MLNINQKLLTNMETWQSKKIALLKKGIWVYLLLLIFEGALRKWVLPGLSDLILIIRDPIAIVLMYYALINNIAFGNFYIKNLVFITIICLVTALAFGHKNLIVAIYGCRITLIHFPLVFFIAKVFTREDVIKIGKFLIYLSIPMTVLIALQFYSPQTAWVNKGIGGNVEGAGFSGAGGYFRPPGTFSFTTGNTAFFAFVIPYVFYFLFFNSSIKKFVLYLSVIAIILAVPLSISRTLFFSSMLTLFFTIVAISKNAKKMGQILGALLAISLIIYYLGSTSIFKTSIGAFADRFTTAGEQEGGIKGTIVDRFLGGMLTAIKNTGESGNTFVGAGIGFGSSVAAKLVTGSQEVFLVAEEEWARIIGEIGSIFGLLIIFMRANLAFSVLNKSWVLVKSGEVLPWLLCSYSFLTILQGGWAQPSNLGFFVVSAGFTLAALKN